jgi:hypothetical protein
LPKSLVFSPQLFHFDERLLIFLLIGELLFLQPVPWSAEKSQALLLGVTFAPTDQHQQGWQADDEQASLGMSHD